MPEQEIGGIVVVTWRYVVLFEGASGLGNRWIWEAYSSRNNKSAPHSNAAICHFTNMHVAASAMYGEVLTRLQGEHKWETTAQNQLQPRILRAIFVHLRMPRWF